MKNQIKNWMVQNRGTLVGTAVFALFPLLCAVIWCLAEGHAIRDVYLPASYWNDELMYYKQVEAIVNHGLPQGYFGFNEAHGNTFYFAAWSPVILLPWCIWGVLFGWSLLSPIYANIVYSMMGLAGFYLLARPDKKQSAWILGLLAVFTPYTRYMLSGMPESVCMALAALFVGFAVAYLKKNTAGRLAGMFLIAFFFMLARPYMGLLFLLPVYFSIKQYKLRGTLVSGGIVAVTAGLYSVIMHACCSPYIEPIVETEWLGIFGEEGLLAGIKYIFETLIQKFSLLFSEHLKRAVKYGLFSGSLYAVTGLLALFIVIRGMLARKKKHYTSLFVLYVHYFVSVAGMILALFLFYRMGEGSKHLMSFIVMGLLLLALTKKKALVLKLFVAAACGYFFILKVFAPYDWQVPFDDGVILAEAEDLEAQVDEKLALSEGEDPYDNTIIWLASDIVDGESIPATWGLLYMMPDGFGINFCTQVHVMEHFDNLQSKYIALLPGGEVEAKVQEAGFVLVAETERMALYERAEEN